MVMLLFVLVLLNALPTAGAMDATPGGIQAAPGDIGQPPPTALLSMMQRAPTSIDPGARSRSPPPKRGDQQFKVPGGGAMFQAARSKRFAEDCYGASLDDTAAARHPDRAHSKAVDAVWQAYVKDFNRDIESQKRQQRKQRAKKSEAERIAANRETERNSRRRSQKAAAEAGDLPLASANGECMCPEYCICDECFDTKPCSLMRHSPRSRKLSFEHSRSLSCAVKRIK